MGFETVSPVVTMNMAISAVISVGLPIVLLIVWKKRNRSTVRLSPFIAGAVTYIVFAMVLESMCHQFFIGRDSAVSRFVNGNTWVYILYAALAAGIFEETGRLFTFHFFMKNDNNKEASITYGIGHGGAESILLVGIAMISNLAMVVSLNSMGGLDAYVASVPAESQEAVRTGLSVLYTTPAYMYLIGGIERISAVFLHIGLSVLVFEAAKRPGKWYLYPVAIGLHALTDAFAVMYQKQVITSMVLTEVLVVLMMLVTVYLAYRVYKKDKETDGDTDTDRMILRQ